MSFIPCLLIFLYFPLKQKAQERHSMLEKDRVKPDGSTLDYEKNLAKIATRGGNCQDYFMN